MMLIDSHCHLDFSDFDNDREDVIKRALKIGIVNFINIGSSLNGSLRSIELAKKYESVFATVGIHPHNAQEAQEDMVLGQIKELARESKVVAIGEVGLDYYRNLSAHNIQQKVFLSLIDIAQELDLPVVLHCRDAEVDLIKILKGFGRSKGVMHCFCGDPSFLDECLNLGLCISFTAHLTYKNSTMLKRVARCVPMDRILLETDSPYLPPQPLRGRRNEPAYLVYVLEELAKIYNVSEEEMGSITYRNTSSLFGI